MIKRVLKIILFAILAIISFILIYVLITLIFSIIPVNKKVDNESNIDIYIHTNGVHTDIVLPIKFDTIDWSKKVKYSDTKGNDTTMKYISFGWGDRGFYLETPTWADLKFSIAFNAAFGLGKSAMHVTYYKDIYKSSDTRKINISKRQLYLINKYIEDSFVKNEKGGFINIKTDMVYGKDDAFYEAIGRYWLFKTCNTWTNTGLKTCEQKACLWTPIDKGIFYHYKENNN